MATTETTLTAEEFRLLPDDGARTELYRGQVIDVRAADQELILPDVLQDFRTLVARFFE